MGTPIMSSRLAQGLLGGAALTLYNSINVVEPGYRGVVYDRFLGVWDRSLGEGTHFLLPWFQTMHMMEVRAQPKVITTRTGSFDLQNVDIGLRLLFRPMFDQKAQVDKLPEVFCKLGPDYEERVLPGITNEVMKAVVAKFDAEKMVTERAKVTNEIRTLLESRANKFNIVFEDVAVVHLKFSDQFSAAVESKQVAHQEAERAAYDVQKAEELKKASVIHAEGQSESAQLVTDAMIKHGPGLLQMRKIEAAREIAKNLSSSRNVTYLPSGGNVLLSIQ